MEISDLQGFLAVAEKNSISKAADSLYISQSTLSRIIKNLEREMNVTLLKRDTRNLELTPEGEIFLKWAKIIVRDYDSMRQEFNHYLTKKTELSIGFYWFPHIKQIESSLNSLTEKVADIELKLLKVQPSAMKEKLKQNTLDVILTNLPDVIHLESVEWISVEKSGLCCVIPAKHVLAKKKSMKLGLLRGEKFISYERKLSSDSYDTIESYCEKAGFKPNIIARAQDIDEMGALVASGMGIAIMSQSSGKVMASNLNVKMIPIEDFADGLDLVVAKKKDNTNYAVNLLWEYLKQSI